MTALEMVIFSHILSRISRPESGNCITLTMVAMSLLTVKGDSSSSEKPEKGAGGGRFCSQCSKGESGTGRQMESSFAQSGEEAAAEAGGGRSCPGKAKP